jgi:hypothetical protein
MNQTGHQIYFGKNKNDYVNSWKEETKTFSNVLELDVKFWDNESIINLIKDCYEEKILLAFLKIKPYAFKSDFARLLVLYIFGGWYSDFGTRFLKKVDPGDSELIVFYDHIAEAIYGQGAIQNSIIYAQKGNHTLKYLIDSLADIILSEDYGQNALDITGPIRLFSLLKKRKHFLKNKEFLYDCGNILAGLSDYSNIGLKGTEKYQKMLSDILLPIPMTVTHVYEMGNKSFALYKDFEKNSTLKYSHDIYADYWRCWDEKIVY